MKFNQQLNNDELLARQTKKIKTKESPRLKYSTIDCPAGKLVKK